MTIQTDLYAPPTDDLERVRGELTLRLDEAAEVDRAVIEDELQRVEAELADRRRAVERAAAAEKGRAQRELDAREAARVEARRLAFERLRELAPRRARAARKVDKALSALIGAVGEWNEIARAQAHAAIGTGLDGHSWSSQAVLAPKLSHELLAALPHSGAFSRWLGDGRDQTFAELDRPYVDISIDDREEGQ